MAIRHSALWLTIPLAVISLACHPSGPQGIDLSHVIAVDHYKWDDAAHESKLSQTFYDRATGNRVVLDGYVLMSRFSDGLCAAQKIATGKAGYLDRNGREATPFEYTMAFDFHEGRALVTVDRKFKRYGLIDPSGKWIIPAGKYEALGEFSEGRCAFRVGKLWGFADKNGAVVLKPQFHSETGPVYRSGLCLVLDQKEEHAVFINQLGQPAIVLPADAAPSSYCDGVARVNYSAGLFGTEGELGYIDTRGKPVTARRYRGAGEFSEGLAAVSSNAQIGFQDDPDPMQSSFSTSKDDLWGFIDKSGKLAIAPRFTRAGRFSCGLARVCQKGKWGFTDPTGKVVIPPIFDWADDFKDGAAKVWLNRKITYIDTRGKVIVVTVEDAVTF